MKHPAPHVWADLAAGRLAAARATALEEHASACVPCHAARGRVAAASQTMAALGDAPPPPLNWDRLGARIHWSVSSELRRRGRAGAKAEGIWTRRLLPFGLAAGAAIAAVTGVIALMAMRDAAPPAPMQGIAPPAPETLPPTGPEQPGPQAPVPSARALEGVVTLAAGDVTVDGEALTLEAELVRGSRIVTTDGRVAVQFGDRSGFVVEPGTEVELAAFDERTIELRIARGAVSLDLTRRAEGQEFSVVAGSRRVAVRGTVFRVERTAEAVDVTCTRGRVSVLGDDGQELELPAGTRLALLDSIHVDRDTAAGRHRVMDDAETARMAAAMRVPLLSAWTDADQVRAGSSVVRVQGSRDIVKIDGVPIASGSFRLRAAPGRHLVESGGSSRWVETGAGEDVEAPIVRRTLRASERAEQLEGQFARHRDAIDGCARSIRKVDPEFRGEMKVAIEIGADGAVRAVYAVKGLSDRDTEDCVLDVVRDRFTFPSGTAETVQRRIGF